MTAIDDATAVVLAGGESRRFGDDEKALATVDGRPLLARVLAVAARATDGVPIVAVATADQQTAYADAVDGPVRFVTDAPDRVGPLAGLASAVEVADAAWLLVLGCDMPLVAVDALEWLGTRRTDGTDAVVPRTADGIHPLCGWYRRDALATALAADRSERSLHALLDRLSVEVVHAEEAPGDVPIERSVCNVNTRDDLAAVRERVED